MLLPKSRLFWIFACFYIRNCEVPGKFALPFLFSREELWLTSVLANDRGWGPGQGAVAESLFGIWLSSEHRNIMWTGAELQWQAWVKGKCCWQQQLGLSLCFPWQLSRSMCSWSPVASQCTTWWDVYCSPEQLKSRGAKDINKKDKSRTWTQMSDHTHS